MFKHTALQRLFLALAEMVALPLQGSSGADKAASGDVMHHLSVTTDLMISVCLELMDLTWEGRRSSGLKVYCQLRTNDSTSDTSKERKTSFSSLSLSFSPSLFQGQGGHWFTVRAKSSKEVKKQTAKECRSLKFRVIATWFCLCVFLSSTPAIKIDFSSWATCECESAAELWSTASARDSELEPHLCTNVFKQSRRWGRVSGGRLFL